MKEIKAIIEAYNLLDTVTTRAALATVVRVEGSSYRRTGARMLVMDNGTWVGGISGGCLEGDALKRARLAIANSEATLITYDTTEDDPYQIGIGLGCNGIIDVLFTPLDTNNPNNPVAVLKACLSAGRQTHVLVTVTRLEGKWNHCHPGDTWQFNGTETVHLADEATVQQRLTQTVLTQVVIGKSAPHRLVTADNRVIETFIEVLPPEINVIIMGHQYDVYPLTRLLKEIGWRVTIVANPLKLNARITGFADQVTAPDNFSHLFVDDYTVIILMSHDFKTDKYNLPRAMQTIAPYVGLLGPKSRSEKMLQELTEEGVFFSDSERERIFAPVGLDIGAVTPEEIALSFVAEVRAVISGRAGGQLRLRLHPINARD